MPDVLTITANWATGSLSDSVISRQYDNNRYRIQFMGYPEGGTEELIFYLLIWMKTEEAPAGAMLPPVQMDSDQWLISNYFTQLAQPIRFQLCIQNAGGTFEAHSPIFNGTVLGSLYHDGEDIDIDTSALFDYYREYINQLIIAAGAVVIDTALDGASTNPVQNKAVKAALDSISENITELSDSVNGRLQELERGGTGGGLTADVKSALLAAFNHVTWDSADPTGQSYISALQTALYPPANLVRISAAYNNSDAVYDTASLDSLKSNLVVTAYYSDGTTDVLSSTVYMLSGTLAEGTSTITVAYGGKTTTFNVTVIEEPAPLYPLTTGVKTWGSDRQVSVYDGNKFKGEIFAGADDTLANLSWIDLNTSSYRSANNNKVGTAKLFTIPAGANVSVSATPIALNYTDDKQVNIVARNQSGTLAFFILADQTALSTLTENVPVTDSFTAESDIDVWNVTTWMKGGAEYSVEFEISVIVDGVKYI